MADVSSARVPQGTSSLRMDRVYMGWQYATLYPEPGPPPRRPTPPGSENLNPAWVAAQRREENLLNRPLKIAAGGALCGVIFFIGLWVSGALPGILASVGMGASLLALAIAGYAVWQGEQALSSRVAEEKERLGRIQERERGKLFSAQQDHARSYRAWQEAQAAYERQLQWYAVSVPNEVDRIDLTGGTLAGWSAAVTMIGAARFATGSSLTVLDLSEGAVAGDLVELAKGSGDEPLVWVLPSDLARLDLGSGLGAEATADILSLVVSVSEEQSTTRDLSFDNAILERVLDVLGEDATIAQVTAAMRALGQVGDPRDDVRAGLLESGQLERIGTLFGRGATDRVVIERAWAMESQLRKLESLGSRAVRLPPARLRVVSLQRQAGVLTNKVLGTYVTTALTHTLRSGQAGQPWAHTLFTCGAEKLRGDVLDRLIDACETTGTGLVLAYRSITPQVKERLGRGNAAVAFMRLGNAEDAKTAAEHIGTEHKFVLSQLTETVGTSVNTSTGDSYTSTVGTSDSVSTSTSTTETKGSSQSRGKQYDGWLSIAASSLSRGKDRNESVGVTDGETLSEGLNKSTAWGATTSVSEGTNDSSARTTQRSREFLVEQHELQQLPPTAFILTHATQRGRRVVFADANPGILLRDDATVQDFEEARDRAGIMAPQPLGPHGAAATPQPGQAGQPGQPDQVGQPGQPGQPGQQGRPEHAELPGRVSHPAASGLPVDRQGEGDERHPPPNLGPPPERLDWRRR